MSSPLERSGAIIHRHHHSSEPFGTVQRTAVAANEASRRPPLAMYFSATDWNDSSLVIASEDFQQKEYELPKSKQKPDNKTFVLVIQEDDMYVQNKANSLEKYGVEVVSGIFKYLKIIIEPNVRYIKIPFRKLPKGAAADIQGYLERVQKQTAEEAKGSSRNHSLSSKGSLWDCFKKRPFYTLGWILPGRILSWLGFCISSIFNRLMCFFHG